MLILEIEQLKFKKLKIIIKIQNLRKRISDAKKRKIFIFLFFDTESIGLKLRKKTKFFYAI